MRAEEEKQRATQLQVQLGHALAEIDVIRQRNDTVSVELKKTRLEKERMSQDIEKLLSSPPKSPEQPEKTRVVPSIDATMVCFIDADGCEEAPAPILSASSDSPVSKSISTVKTTYQPTLVTPGVHVERDANLLVERALASLQAPPSDSFGFASVAQSDDNALPVANLFGSSPPPSPPAASSPPPPPVAPPQSSSPPSLPALSIPEAQLIPPPEESPQLSVAWHPLRKLPNVSESNESLDSMTIGGPTTARANHSSGNSSTGHLSSHASVPSTGNLATQPAAAMFLQGNPFAMRSSFESSPREPMLYPANTMSQVYQPMQQPAQPFSMQMQQTDLSKQIRRQRRLTCASQDSEMMKSNFSGVPTQPSPSPQPQMIEPQQSGLMNGGMQPMNGAYQQSLQQQQPRALPTSAMARRSKRLSNTMEPAPSWARTHPS